MLIDWAALARNALWILGLSVALAAWSYASWQAGVQRIRLRQALRRPACQAPFYLGLLLFSAGLAWGARRTWELIAWIILAVAFAWQAASALRRASRQSGP